MVSFSSFSFRETVQILLPGLYFCAILQPLLFELEIPYDSNFKVANVAVNFIASIFFGIFIYFIDLPKSIWFFKLNVPTYKILQELKRNNPNVSFTKDKLARVDNVYYEFYDTKVSEKQKSLIDRYITLFHLSINVSLVSLIVILLYAPFYTDKFLNSYGLYALFFFIIGIVNGLGVFYGKKKINYHFSRQAVKFFESDIYRNFVI